MDVLPCPFCGAMPDVREALDKEGDWAVGCANFDCYIMPRTKWYLSYGDKDAKTRAIEVWNRRAENFICSQGHDMRG